jgi:hypothetical protein
MWEETDIGREEVIKSYDQSNGDAYPEGNRKEKKGQA